MELNQPENINSSEFKDRVLDLSVNGIYVYDLIKGTNVYINKQYTELTGYTLGEINSFSKEEFFALFHEDDHELIVKHMQEVVELELGEVSEVEYRFKKADGSWMWCLSRDAIFSKNKDGVNTQFMGTFIDITDRKNLELLLNEANDTLDQKVKARTEELNKSIENQALLMREIHHRVKNNLQLLSSLLNLYRSKESNPKIANVIDECKSKIQSIALIYNSLHKTDGLTDIDFKEYLIKLIEYLDDTLKGDRDIQTMLDIDELHISIDSSITLGLILNELITNSYKHAFRQSNSGQIFISAKRIKDSLVFSVEDSGNHSAEIEKINKDQSFGMMMIETLVEQLDGKIELNKTKKGLRFKLAFSMSTVGRI